VGIRNAAKALILHDGRILVNRCMSSTGEVYYDLPGGGQRTYETMEEAVVREVEEETGYRVRIVRFSALTEEIHDNEALRSAYPEYCHRLHHIFLTQLAEEEAGTAVEMDFQQQESIWVTPKEADRLPFFPVRLNGQISRLISSDVPVYLGSEHVTIPFCF